MNFKDPSKGVQENAPPRRNDHRESALSTHHAPQSSRRKVRGNFKFTDFKEAAASATYAANCCGAPVPTYYKYCNRGLLPHL
jgi:hypothetical protein